MDPNQTEIWTIMRLITWGADYFRKKRIDSSRLTMELLVAHVLKLSRFDLYMQFDRPLAAAELDELRGLVRRRVAREPLQYLTGEAHFHGRIFSVTRDVLIPRPETELLVEEALRRTSFLRCLDVGTGSGCIGITVALQHPDAEIVAIDKSAAAIDVARANAERMGVRNIDLRVLDFLDNDAVAELGSFDLVISNPPYIPAADIAGLDPEVRKFEPHLALTDNGDGLGFYRRFIELLPVLLRDGGSIILELGWGQASSVAPMFRAAGLSVDILTDLDRVERILLGCRTAAR